MSRFVFLLAASALALTGCGSGGSNNAADAANAAIEGRTDNGQLSARVQGVDLKINLPPPIRRMTEGGDFLYPGANAERGGDRFHSDDPPEMVARWYQDAARANRFTITTATRQGSFILLAGAARNGDVVSIRLSPGAGGGTDGTIAVAPHN
jgi:hypothetical protein